MTNTVLCHKCCLFPTDIEQNKKVYYYELDLQPCLSPTTLFKANSDGGNMACGKFCSNCGMLVYTSTAFCKNCGAPIDDAVYAHSGQTQSQPWKSLGIRVEEFKSKKDFNRWLENMYTRIKVLRVIPFTLPWLTECYTVTYELFALETPSPKLAPSLEIPG